MAITWNLIQEKKEKKIKGQICNKMQSNKVSQKQKDAL